MNATRRGSIIANLIATTLSQVVAVGGQLVIVPAFLASWGDAAYGDWLTLSALSSYLSLTDMGMQMYVVNQLTGHAVRGEEPQLKATLHSALALYALLSGLALAVLFAAGLLLPWHRWFSARALSGPQVQTIVLVLGVSVIASVWGGFVSSLYRVFGEPQRSSSVGLVQRTLVLGVSFAILTLGGSPVAMALMQLAVALVYMLWAGHDVRRRHPVAALSFAHAEQRTALSMIVPSGLFALLGIANGLTIQGSLLVASAALGPAAVTVFATSRTLANVVKQAVALVGYVAWPEFTRIDAGGSSKVLASGHRLLVKICSLATTWVVCTLWFSGGIVHQLWTRGKTQFDHELMRILLAHALLLAPSGASGVLLAATNRHRALSLLYLVQGLVTVSLSAVLVRVHGLAGIAAAILATDVAVFSILIPKWSLEAVGEPLSGFMVEIYLKLALIVAATFAASLLVQQGGLSPGASIAATVAATFVPVAIGFVLWLQADERDLIRGVVSRRRARA